MANSRLSMARNQYESLLLSAREMVNQEQTQPKQTSSRQSSVHLYPRKPTAPVDSIGHESENVILHLQEEIERLKAKINLVVDQAEKNNREFQDTEEELRLHFISVEEAYAAKLLALDEENKLLRASVDACRETIASEKQQLANALRVIDRLQRREKEIHCHSNLSTAVRQRALFSTNMKTDIVSPAF